MEYIKSDKQTTLVYILFAVYLLVLTWLVLFKLQFFVPVIEEGRVLNLIPFQGLLSGSGMIELGEIRNNILAFIPLGIYICMLRRNWPFLKKVLAISALTVGFEAVQFIFAIGRADITDVISNALGGIIGIGIYALLSKLLKGRTNKAISIFAAVLTALAISLIAFLMLNHRWIRIQ